jgi:hypothetical protein
MAEFITASVPSGAQALPPLTDGAVVSDPGTFAFSGELIVEGAVALRHLTLYLAGPARVRAGARLTLEGVRSTQPR